MLHLPGACVYVACVGGCESSAVTSSFNLCPYLPSLNLQSEASEYGACASYSRLFIALAVLRGLCFILMDRLIFVQSFLSPSLFVCLVFVSSFSHFPPLSLLCLSLPPTHTHDNRKVVIVLLMGVLSCLYAASWGRTASED